MKQSNNWVKTGEEILHSVIDAIDQQDFSGLSKNIENTVNEFVQSAGQKYNATQEWLKEKQAREAARQAQEARRSGAHQTGAGQAGVNVTAVQLYKKNPPGTYAGITFQVLGIVGLGVFGMATFVLTLLSFATGLMGVWLANMITGVLMAGSGIMLSCGLKLKKRVRRFRNYVSQVEAKQYARIEDLAAAVGKKKKFVEKEIRHMIHNGFFLQGHLDHAGTTLITSNAMYEQYLQAEKSRKEREITVASSCQEAVDGQYSPQVLQILEEGTAYIEHIRRCNEAIPGEVMSSKLETLENIMKRIFEQLKKDSESGDELQKFMKYYLPTTTKLLDAYCELDARPSYGSGNIETTKKEIEDTLDVINAAFAKLLDDMFEEVSWDISADISTMKTMLAKDGLTGEKDFKIQ